MFKMIFKFTCTGGTYGCTVTKMDFDTVCITSTKIISSAFINFSRFLIDTNLINLWKMTTQNQKWKTSKKGSSCSFLASYISNVFSHYNPLFDGFRIPRIPIELSLWCLPMYKNATQCIYVQKPYYILFYLILTCTSKCHLIKVKSWGTWPTAITQIALYFAFPAVMIKDHLRQKLSLSLHEMHIFYCSEQP